MNLEALFRERVKIVGKDARRIAMFQAACQAKMITLVREDPQNVVPFIAGSAQLAGDWLERGFDVAKNPWKALFTADPFKDLRQRARVFASQWSLDPAFIKELG